MVEVASSQGKPSARRKAAMLLAPLDPTKAYDSDRDRNLVLIFDIDVKKHGVVNDSVELWTISSWQILQDGVDYGHLLDSWSIAPSESSTRKNALNEIWGEDKRVGWSRNPSYPTDGNLILTRDQEAERKDYSARNALEHLRSQYDVNSKEAKKPGRPDWGTVRDAWEASWNARKRKERGARNTADKSNQWPSFTLRGVRRPDTLADGEDDDNMPLYGDIADEEVDSVGEDDNTAHHIIMWNKVFRGRKSRDGVVEVGLVRLAHMNVRDMIIGNESSSDTPSNSSLKIVNRMS